MLLIAASSALLGRWWGLRQAWEEAPSAAGDPGQRTTASRDSAEASYQRAARTAHRQFSSFVGQLGSAPAPAQLEQALARWGPPPVVQGWSALDATAAGQAARLELNRWFQVGPGATSKVERLGIESFAQDSEMAAEAGIDLILVLVGPEATLRPWLEHLLKVEEGQGYLTEVLHLRWSLIGPDLWRAELRLRLWVASYWLETSSEARQSAANARNEAEAKPGGS